MYCNASGLRLPSGNCSAGSFSADGASACMSCVAGSYQPQEGRGLCLQCPAGSFCASVGLLYPSGLCDPGWHSPGNAVSCRVCPVGTFSSVNGSSSCSMCTAGFISLSGRSYCQQVMHPAIVFKLHGNVESFADASDRRSKFISLLVEKLSLLSSFEPIIVSVRSGSVLVDVAFYQHPGSALSIDDVMLRLRASFRSGDFESIGVMSLTIGDETISQPDSALISLSAIVVISAICFLMICMFGMVALKRRLDANKIHPFVSDKHSSVVHVDVQPSGLSFAATGSALSPSPSPSPSPSKPSIVAALARSAPQDLDPGAVFRRVLPRYETVPAVNSSATVASGLPSSAHKKRDAPYVFAANPR
jgi:hypothetical protein